MSAKTKDPRRWVLMNPGPVNVSDRVRKALLQPDLCHREKEFAQILKSIRQKLLGIFKVKNTHQVVLLTGSGTLAVESMIASFGAGSRKILILSNGVYGQRLRKIAQAHRIPHRFLESPPGEFPDLSRIQALLRQDKAIRGVALAHHETSSGMLNPLSEVGRLAKKFKKTLLVDAVSSLGAEKVDFQKDGIGFLAGSAGKCLHGYPGVSFIFVSKKEMAALSKGKADSLYMDLWAILQAENAGSVPFTPAVQLFYAFEESLNELADQGLEKRQADYAAKAAFLERGFEKLGLQFLAPKKYRSHVLSALWLPAGVSYSRLHDPLKKEGFVIYAGQSSLKDRIFRVSHMGDIRPKDLERFLRCLRLLLRRPKSSFQAILLAAGRGKRLGRLTRTLPKCLIPLGKGRENLLKRYFRSFRECGIQNVVIVCGYLKEKIKAECKKIGRGLKIRFIENPDYERGSFLSLQRAAKALNRDVLIMDADVYFPAQGLKRLLSSPQKSAFLADPRSNFTGEEMMLLGRNGRPWTISKSLDPSLQTLGEATGILKLQKKDALLLRKTLGRLAKADPSDSEYEESYLPLMRQTKIGWETMDGLFWSEMDFEEDLKKIQKIAAC